MTKVVLDGVTFNFNGSDDALGHFLKLYYTNNSVRKAVNKQ